MPAVLKKTRYKVCCALLFIKIIMFKNGKEVEARIPNRMSKLLGHLFNESLSKIECSGNIMKWQR